jgi:outer membrane protein W
MKYLILLVMIFFIPFLPLAQNVSECLDKYQKAGQMYNDGDYFSCAENLERALSICEFSQSDKEKVLILLTEAYIELDNIKAAESTLKKLFRNNPLFTPKTNEVSEDFMILMKRYKKHPLVSAGIRYAFWQPYLKITHTYSVLEGVDYSVPYSTGILYQKFFVWAEYEFHKNIAVSAEFTSFSFSYSRTLEQAFENKSTFSLNYTEKMQFFEVPVLLKVYFPVRSSILPYVSAGLGWLHITDSGAEAAIAISEPVSYPDPFVGSDNGINVIKMRTQNCFEWIAAAGIGYKMKNWKFNIDVRYCGGMSSLTDKDARSNNDLLLNKYYYIDNSVKLNFPEVGISVSYALMNSVSKTK